MSYHKDKVIDARIHEQLCALKMDVKGRIDHPVGGHDDLVIAWALALFVLYRGGDIANDFGITRHMIKTDADVDEELYDVKNGDSEIITDKIEIIENSEIDQQMQILESAPGRMSFEEWRNAEMAAEVAALNNILSTKAGRDAYIQKYNLNPEDVNEEKMTTIPNSVFTDFYSDMNQMEQQTTGRGNLYNSFMKVMNVR